MTTFYEIALIILIVALPIKLIYQKFIIYTPLFTPVTIGFITGILFFCVLLANFIGLALILILSLFVLGYFYMKDKKKQGGHSKIGAFCSIGIILFATVLMFSKFVFTAKTVDDFRTEENHFAKASALMLGEIFAKKCPNSKALIIVRKGYEKNRRKDALLDALEDGFGDKIEIKKIVFIDEGMPENSADGDIMKAVNFDKILEANQDCEVVISTIGLPLDVDNMKIWDKKIKDRPKIGLLNVYVPVVRNAIKAEYISAAVISRPKAVIDGKKLPEDLKKVFDLRYLMITPENVDDINVKNPGLFY